MVFGNRDDRFENLRLVILTIDLDVIPQELRER